MLSLCEIVKYSVHEREAFEGFGRQTSRVHLWLAWSASQWLIRCTLVEMFRDHPLCIVPNRDVTTYTSNNYTYKVRSCISSSYHMILATGKPHSGIKIKQMINR